MELIYTSKMPYRYQGQIPEFQRALMVRQTAFPPRDRQRMITDMVEAKVPFSSLESNVPIFRMAAPVSWRSKMKG